MHTNSYPITRKPWHFKKIVEKLLLTIIINIGIQKNNTVFFFLSASKHNFESWVGLNRIGTYLKRRKGECKGLHCPQTLFWWPKIALLHHTPLLNIFFVKRYTSAVQNDSFKLIIHLKIIFNNNYLYSIDFKNKISIIKSTLCLKPSS